MTTLPLLRCVPRVLNSSINQWSGALEGIRGSFAVRQKQGSPSLSRSLQRQIIEESNAAPPHNDVRISYHQALSRVLEENLRDLVVELLKSPYVTAKGLDVISNLPQLEARFRIRSDLM